MFGKLTFAAGAFALAAIVSGCGGGSGGGGSGGGGLSGSVTLAGGACFGTCPIYDMTLNAGGAYSLNGVRFTRTVGVTTGTLPPGRFAQALAALTTAGFASLPTDITPGNPAACGGPVATDLPPATVTANAGGVMKTVTYYPGCFGSPHKAAMDQLIDDLRAAMNYSTLVAP